MTPWAMGNEWRVLGKVWGVKTMGKTAFGSDTENLVERRVVRVQIKGERAQPLQLQG